MPLSNLSPYQLSLLPASFNGAPFQVEDTTLKGGQRIAEHQYYGRDVPYTEPLGRQGSIYKFTGFVLSTPGINDVAGKFATLQAALWTDGPGTLVHPVLGTLNVVCNDLETTWNLAGGFVELRLSFVEAGQILYPTSGADTQAATINAAANGQATAGQTFGTNMQNGNTQPAALVSPTAQPSPSQEQMNDAGDNAVLSNSTGFDVA